MNVTRSHVKKADRRASQSHTKTRSIDYRQTARPDIRSQWEDMVSDMGEAEYKAAETSSYGT